MIRTKATDWDQLFARLDDIKSRTKSSIEMSRRLIDESFLRFKTTHRNLYAAQLSQEQLNALPRKKDSAAGFGEPSNLSRTPDGRGALPSAGLEGNLTCDHCEGALLNNKAYQVRTHDYGVILLDVVVCYACHLEAKNLGLETYELQSADGESEPTAQKNRPIALACPV